MGDAKSQVDVLTTAMAAMDVKPDSKQPISLASSSQSLTTPAILATPTTGQDTTFNREDWLNKMGLHGPCANTYGTLF